MKKPDFLLQRYAVWALGLCVSLFARNLLAMEVTLYGGVDVGLSYVHTQQNGHTANNLGMDSSVVNDSMIGFRGSEALNDDWTVSFDLASEIDVNNGELAYDAFFGLESTLGLTRRDWGSVKLGRQQTVSTDFFTDIDPMGLNFGQANMGTSFTAINTQIYDNLIQFTSSDWAGMTIGLGYSFNTGETAIYAGSGVDEPVPSSTGFGNRNKMRALTAAIQYESEPLLLAASYDKAFPSDTLLGGSSDAASANPVATSPQAWYFGVAYTVDQVVLSAAWGRGINGAFSGAGPGNNLSDSPLTSVTGQADMLFSQGFNQDSYLLGFSWAIDSRTQFMASWQMLKPSGQLAQVPDIGTMQVLGAAITYNLSPRTSVYLWASYGNNFELVSGAKASVIGTGIQTLF